jgi:hypothetical protein
LATVPAVVNEFCTPVVMGFNVCVSNPVQHLFLVTEVNGTPQQVIDAGPPDQKPTWPPLGYIQTWVTPTGHYGELTNPAANALAQTSFPCKALSGLLSDAINFPKNIPYMGAISNSNSFVYTLSVDWDLATPRLGELYPGWGQYLLRDL